MGIKHCWNDHSSTFIMTLHWSKTHWVGKHRCLSDLKGNGCLVTRWLSITCILVVRWKKYQQRVQIALSQKRKIFSGIFIAFSQSTQNYVHFEKKDQLYRFNIWEVINSEKCGYLNARKLLFQNTLPESTCSRVLNTADFIMAALLSWLSFDRRHKELEKISVSEIWNLRTVW